jgi:hypothetical protein
LARLHQLLARFSPSFTAPTGTYHHRAVIAPLLNDLPALLGTGSSAGGGWAAGEQIGPVAAALALAYAQAAERAERAAGPIADRARQLTHGDWHPGNFLLSERPGDPTIVAVLDFDSVRVSQSLLDVANGAFQCSVRRRLTPLGGEEPVDGAPAKGHGDGPEPPAGISISMNAELFRRFFAGYRQGAPGHLSGADLAAVPWLMIEAIIVETVTPIATTGRFGRVNPLAALAMARQVVDWVAADAETLVSLAAER